MYTVNLHFCLLQIPIPLELQFKKDKILNSNTNIEVSFLPYKFMTFRKNIKLCE